MKKSNFNSKNNYEAIWWSFWAVVFVICLLGYVFGGIDPLQEFGK